MCFTFQKNNKQTKKPFNCFLQDGASASIGSLQTSIEIKLSRVHGMSRFQVICQDEKNHDGFKKIINFKSISFVFVIYNDKLGQRL